jgi:hypothetical protein
MLRNLDILQQDKTISLPYQCPYILSPHWLNVGGTGIRRIENAKISTLYPLYFLWWTLE